MNKRTVSIFSQAFKKWKSRDPYKESAVIAFNAIFALPGLLVVVITWTSYFFGARQINEQLHSSIADAMGNDTADQVQAMILMAAQNKSSTWATILGIVTILLGATGVFVQMQKSLNIIWEVRATTKKSGAWTYVKTRLFSFGLILSIAFLLLISLVITALLAAVGNWIKIHWSESLVWLFNILDFLVSLFFVAFLFGLMYKVLPDVKIRWKVVWRGALVTALLFEIGKTLLGLYFGLADLGSGYGTAGSIVLILIWSSYSAMIVLYGAEITKVYADRYIGEVPVSDIALKEEGRVL